MALKLAQLALESRPLPGGVEIGEGVGDGAGHERRARRRPAPARTRWRTRSRGTGVDHADQPGVRIGGRQPVIAGQHDAGGERARNARAHLELVVDERGRGLGRRHGGVVEDGATHASA